MLGYNEETDIDFRKLAALLQEENTHFQWKKWSINIACIIMLGFMNYNMPTASRASPIGMTMCSTSFWLIQVVFYVFLGFVVWY